MSARAFEREMCAMIEEIARKVVREELAKAAQHEQYLSPAKAAAVAEVATGTIRRWIRERKLKGHHAGRRVRVSRAELERYLRADHRPVVQLSPEELAARDFG